MRKLINIEYLKDCKLFCTFSDGTIKIADISTYINTPAFEPLKNEKSIENFVNKDYFIEWSEFELDISADTLWHMG